jgi:hypothetical protein
LRLLDGGQFGWSPRVASYVNSAPRVGSVIARGLAPPLPYTKVPGDRESDSYVAGGTRSEHRSDLTGQERL